VALQTAEGPMMWKPLTKDGELEDMIGVILRLGQQHGIATPLTFAMYAALKPAATGRPDPAAS
jgi:ketopantoate reductase